MVRFVLASGSPRRRELLEQMGLTFEISSAHGEEVITKTLPAEIVEELSRQKADEVADRYAQTYKNDTCVIIGADTIVAFGNEIMGKPHDNADAVRMLTQLAGNTHQAYVATGEPSDKAGAYAIQGRCAAYIKGINGEYNNVVGLPVARLMQELLALGLA